MGYVESSETTLKFRSDPFTPNNLYSHLIPPQKLSQFDSLCEEINKVPSGCDEQLDELCSQLETFRKYKLEKPVPVSF